MMMAQRVAVWHGSDKALERLLLACKNNCQCDRDTGHVCEPHKMLSDQNTLDHLAFVWKVREAYRQGEFVVRKRKWW